MTRWVLPLAFLSALSATASESPVRAKTEPTHVTVYPNGARVTREGTIELKEGPHAVLFADLPASIVEPSLRVSVEGPKGTKYFGVSFKKQFTDKVVDARTRKIKDQLQSLHDRRTALTDKMEARRTEINMLRTYGLIQNRKNKPVNLKDFTDSAETIRKKVDALMADNRKDERAIRDIDLKVAALNNELAQGSAGAREKRTAQADVELSQAGKTRFKLTYQVAGASWSPTYDLNLASKEEPPVVELSFDGNVRQSTGEDWKSVTLTLSTARPTEATQVPDPTNWWLNYYVAQTEIYRRNFAVPGAAPPSAAEAPRAHAAAKKMVEGKADELEPAELELAKTIQSEYSANYEITVPKEIPSDGSDHRVGIQQAKYPVTLSEVIVPKLSLAAFVAAKVNYAGDQILLPGPAQLLHDGEFVGNANLAAKAPGESFDLGFGQDDLIRTERKKGDTQSSKGDFRALWITTVSNYHGGDRAVEVREQVPRTQQKDIQIETADLDPKPEPEDPEKPGLLVWKLALKPKEKGTIHFGYRVRYPENMVLPGLE